ncbi:MAG: hypothetical protein Q8L88_00210 [Bacteroidota bacterium]|nr:hypothetical protein [Bacteroidota bacterium]
MKTFHPFPIFFSLFILFAVTLNAQNDSRKIIISNIIGESIDQSEREQYHILPAIKNFVSATFYVMPDSTYFAKVEITGDDGQISFTRVDYSTVTLFMLAEKINHYEELGAGNYVMGQDPAKIQIVGGSEISWNPPPTRILESTTLPAGPPSILDGPLKSSSFEIRISGGYGFAKEGLPITSEDYTSSNNGTGYSTSHDNVKDIYISAGEGIRFEADFIYYLTDQAGIFLQTGYSWGSATAKSSYTSSSSFPPNPPSSYSSTTDQTLNFSTIPLLTGLHLKTDIGNVQPYAGVGAGFIVQSNLTIGLKQTNNASQFGPASTAEREMKLTNNIPVAYVGYLGFDVPINPDVTFFIQAKATLVSFFITRSEITKYTIDGADQLSTLTERDKIVEYEEDKSYTETSGGDPTKPRFGGAPYPFVGSSIGITFGISFGR